MSGPPTSSSLPTRPGGPVPLSPGGIAGRVTFSPTVLRELARRWHALADTIEALPLGGDLEGTTSTGQTTAAIRRAAAGIGSTIGAMTARLHEVAYGLEVCIGAGVATDADAAVRIAADGPR
ncbi:hypothetical protein [Williamsia sterculiae]|uniref:Uncharacterized protein n=1 Tax=Williamsia sterculiae TaxID=1344003 RepID=A0A1N7EJ96_9NOCA|nr:hypothetical protein [Williamsia sterculiae]SIR88183.1 hypothetical protein SAMN05445060_1372 [Williamsia sterculiae]